MPDSLASLYTDYSLLSRNSWIRAKTLNKKEPSLNILYLYSDILNRIYGRQ